MKPEEEKEIGLGSVVRLNSGGPEMTVIERGRSNDSFECLWFNTTYPSYYQAPQSGLAAGASQKPTYESRHITCNKAALTFIR